LRYRSRDYWLRKVILDVIGKKGDLNDDDLYKAVRGAGVPCQKEYLLKIRSRIPPEVVEQRLRKDGGERGSRPEENPHEIGKRYLDSEDYRKATIGLSKAFNWALDVVKDYDNDIKILVVLCSIAEDLGYSYFMLGDYARSEAYYNTARLLAGKIADRGENENEKMKMHGEIVSSLAEVYITSGRLEEAIACYREALWIWRRISELCPVDYKSRLNICVISKNIGAVYASLKRDKKDLLMAIDWTEYALKKYESLLDEKTNESNLRKEVAFTRYNLANIYFNFGDVDLALKLYEKTAFELNEIFIGHLYDPDFLRMFGAVNRSMYAAYISLRMEDKASGVLTNISQRLRDLYAQTENDRRGAGIGGKDGGERRSRQRLQAFGGWRIRPSGEPVMKRPAGGAGKKIILSKKDMVLWPYTLRWYSGLGNHILEVFERMPRAVFYPRIEGLETLVNMSEYYAAMIKDYRRSINAGRAHFVIANFLHAISDVRISHNTESLLQLNILSNGSPAPVLIKGNYSGGSILEQEDSGDIGERGDTGPKVIFEREAEQFSIMLSGILNECYMNYSVVLLKSQLDNVLRDKTFLADTIAGAVEAVGGDIKSSEIIFTGRIYVAALSGNLDAEVVLCEAYCCIDGDKETAIEFVLNLARNPLPNSCIADEYVLMRLFHQKYPGYFIKPFAIKSVGIKNNSGVENYPVYSAEFFSDSYDLRPLFNGRHNDAEQNRIISPVYEWWLRQIVYALLKVYFESGCQGIDNFTLYRGDVLIRGAEFRICACRGLKKATPMEYLADLLLESDMIDGFDRKRADNQAEVIINAFKAVASANHYRSSEIVSWVDQSRAVFQYTTAFQKLIYSGRSEEKIRKPGILLSIAGILNPSRNNTRRELFDSCCQIKLGEERFDTITDTRCSMIDPDAELQKLGFELAEITILNDHNVNMIILLSELWLLGPKFNLRGFIYLRRHLLEQLKKVIGSPERLILAELNSLNKMNNRDTRFNWQKIDYILSLKYRFRIWADSNCCHALRLVEMDTVDYLKLWMDIFEQRPAGMRCEERIVKARLAQLSRTDFDSGESFQDIISGRREAVTAVWNLAKGELLRAEAGGSVINGEDIQIFAYRFGNVFQYMFLLTKHSLSFISDASGRFFLAYQDRPLQKLDDIIPLWNGADVWRQELDWEKEEAVLPGTAELRNIGFKDDELTELQATGIDLKILAEGMLQVFPQVNLSGFPWIRRSLLSSLRREISSSGKLVMYDLNQICDVTRGDSAVPWETVDYILGLRYRFIDWVGGHWRYRQCSLQEPISNTSGYLRLWMERFQLRPKKVFWNEYFLNNVLAKIRYSPFDGLDSDETTSYRKSALKVMVSLVFDNQESLTAGRQEIKLKDLLVLSYRYNGKVHYMFIDKRHLFSVSIDASGNPRLILMKPRLDELEDVVPVFDGSLPAKGMVDWKKEQNPSDNTLQKQPEERSDNQKDDKGPSKEEFVNLGFSAEEAEALLKSGADLAVLTAGIKPWIPEKFYSFLNLRKCLIAAVQGKGNSMGEQLVGELSALTALIDSGKGLSWESVDYILGLQKAFSARIKECGYNGSGAFSFPQTNGISGYLRLWLSRFNNRPAKIETNDMDILEKLRMMGVTVFDAGPEDSKETRRKLAVKGIINVAMHMAEPVDVSGRQISNAETLIFARRIAGEYQYVLLNWKNSLAVSCDSKGQLLSILPGNKLGGMEDVLPLSGGMEPSNGRFKWAQAAPEKEGSNILWSKELSVMGFSQDQISVFGAYGINLKALVERIEHTQPLLTISDYPSIWNRIVDSLAHYPPQDAQIQLFSGISQLEELLASGADWDMIDYIYSLRRKFDEIPAGQEALKEREFNYPRAGIAGYVKLWLALFGQRPLIPDIDKEELRNIISQVEHTVFDQGDIAQVEERRIQAIGAVFEILEGGQREIRINDILFRQNDISVLAHKGNAEFQYLILDRTHMLGIFLNAEGRIVFLSGNAAPQNLKEIIPLYDGRVMPRRDEFRWVRRPWIGSIGSPREKRQSAPCYAKGSEDTLAASGTAEEKTPVSEFGLVNAGVVKATSSTAPEVDFQQADYMRSQQVLVLGELIRCYGPASRRKTIGLPESLTAEDFSVTREHGQIFKPKVITAKTGAGIGTYYLITALIRASTYADVNNAKTVLKTLYALSDVQKGNMVFKCLMKQFNCNISPLVFVYLGVFKLGQFKLPGVPRPVYVIIQGTICKERLLELWPDIESWSDPLFDVDSLTRIGVFISPLPAEGMNELPREELQVEVKQPAEGCENIRVSSQGGYVADIPVVLTADRGSVEKRAADDREVVVELNRQYALLKRYGMDISGTEPAEGNDYLARSDAWREEWGIKRLFSGWGSSTLSMEARVRAEERKCEDRRIARALREKYDFPFNGMPFGEKIEYLVASDAWRQKWEISESVERGWVSDKLEAESKERISAVSAEDVDIARNLNLEYEVLQRRFDIDIVLPAELTAARGTSQYLILSAGWRERLGIYGDKTTGWQSRMLERELTGRVIALQEENLEVWRELETRYGDVEMLPVLDGAAYFPASDKWRSDLGIEQLEDGSFDSRRLRVESQFKLRLEEDIEVLRRLKNKYAILETRFAVKIDCPSRLTKALGTDEYINCSSHWRSAWGITYHQADGWRSAKLETALQTELSDLEEEDKRIVDQLRQKYSILASMTGKNIDLSEELEAARGKPVYIELSDAWRESLGLEILPGGGWDSRVLAEMATVQIRKEDGIVHPNNVALLSTVLKNIIKELSFSYDETILFICCLIATLNDYKNNMVSGAVEEDRQLLEKLGIRSNDNLLENLLQILLQEEGNNFKITDIHRSQFSSRGLDLEDIYSLLRILIVSLFKDSAEARDDLLKKELRKLFRELQNRGILKIRKEVEDGWMTFFWYVDLRTARENPEKIGEVIQGQSVALAPSNLINNNPELLYSQIFERRVPVDGWVVTEEGWTIASQLDHVVPVGSSVPEDYEIVIAASPDKNNYLEILRFAEVSGIILKKVGIGTEARFYIDPRQFELIKEYFREIRIKKDDFSKVLPELVKANGNIILVNRANRSLYQFIDISGIEFNYTMCIQNVGDKIVDMLHLPMDKQGKVPVNILGELKERLLVSEWGIKRLKDQNRIGEKSEMGFYWISQSDSESIVGHIIRQIIENAASRELILTVKEISRYFPLKKKGVDQAYLNTIEQKAVLEYCVSLGISGFIYKPEQRQVYALGANAEPMSAGIIGMLKSGELTLKDIFLTIRFPGERSDGGETTELISTIPQKRHGLALQEAPAASISGLIEKARSLEISTKYLCQVALPKMLEALEAYSGQWVEPAVQMLEQLMDAGIIHICKVLEIGVSLAARFSKGKVSLYRDNLVLLAVTLYAASSRKDIPR